MHDSISIQEENIRTLESHGQTSDGELLRRFRRSGDADAFSQIVDRFRPLVLSIAMRSLSNRHSAEDVFQATFLVLARDASKIRTPDSLAAWLYGTAMRISKRANSENHPRLSLEHVEIASSQSSPFEAIHEQYQQEVIHEELDRLPERYRSVLVLHIVEGKTCEQTAAALGTTTGSVRGRLQRAKRDFKLQLIRRGIQTSAVMTVIGLNHSAAEASITNSLTTSTVQGSIAHMSGAPAVPWCSLHASQLAAMETVMYSSFSKLLTACALLAVTVTLGLFAGSADAKAAELRVFLDTRVAANDPANESETVAFTVPAEVSRKLTLVVLQTEVKIEEKDAAQQEQPSKITLLVNHGDDKPDGKKSIARTGVIIRFSLPNEGQKLRGLKMHCARYGYPQAPKENVKITIVDEDGKTVHAEPVPYATFKRGESKWTNVRFKDEIKVPKTFSAIVEFNAERTKGVFLSYDTNTGGKHSKTGVPGGVAKAVSFKGDWMIQAILTRSE